MNQSQQKKKNKTSVFKWRYLFRCISKLLKRKHHFKVTYLEFIYCILNVFSAVFGLIFGLYRQNIAPSQRLIDIKYAAFL